MTLYLEIKKKEGISLNLIQKNFSVISENFLCLVCQKLVVSPICCEKCQQFYCNDCLEVYLSLKIKNERKCLGKIYNSNKTCYSNLKNICDLIVKREKQILDEIEIKCEYDGCNKIFIYKDYVKHLNQCQYKSFKCTECDFISSLENILFHIDKCEEIYVKCNECKIMFKRKNIKEHYEICEEKLRTCNICKENVKLKEFDKHNNTKCFWEIYNFTRDNIKKVSKYDKLICRRKRLEDKIEKITQRLERNQRQKKLTLKKENYLKNLKFSELSKNLRKKRKIFQIDKKRNDKSVNLSKMGEIIISKSLLNYDFEMSTKPVEYYIPAEKDDDKQIKWNNNSLIYCNNDLKVITICSSNQLPDDFTISIKINKIYEKKEGMLSAIGFSNKPICEENYVIGKTNRSEWALMQDGIIVENDDFKNDIFHYEIKFNDGDLIKFTYYDKHINFFINGIPFDYQWYFSCKHMFLIATIFQGEEFEITDKK